MSHIKNGRQRDFGGLTSLDETTLTRNLRPLMEAGWVAASTGTDQQEARPPHRGGGGQAATGAPSLGAPPGSRMRIVPADGNLVRPSGAPAGTHSAGRPNIILIFFGPIT